MPYLLDTNAFRKADKPQPNEGFMDWLNQAEVSELYVSCIALGELYKGIELLKLEQLDELLNSLIEH